MKWNQNLIILKYIVVDIWYNFAIQAINFSNPFLALEYLQYCQKLQNDRFSTYLLMIQILVNLNQIDRALQGFIKIKNFVFFMRFRERFDKRKYWIGLTCRYIFMDWMTTIIFFFFNLHFDFNLVGDMAFLINPFDTKLREILILLDPNMF